MAKPQWLVADGQLERYRVFEHDQAALVGPSFTVSPAELAGAACQLCHVDGQDLVRDPLMMAVGQLGGVILWQEVPESGP
jgi:hypothetical protein